MTLRLFTAVNISRWSMGAFTVTKRKYLLKLEKAN